MRVVFSDSTNFTWTLLFFISYKCYKRIASCTKNFAIENGIAAPYNFIDTRLLIINNVSDTSSWSFRFTSASAFDQSYSYIQDNFTPYEYKNLLDRIINDNNIDPNRCSSSIYCYDFLTKQIHVIPYSIETYMDLLKLSINNQLDIVGYIDATV